MNPILDQIYSTIIPSMPYLIAAYVLVWVVLAVYIVVIMRATKRAERQMDLIEEALAEKAGGEKVSGE